MKKMARSGARGVRRLPESDALRKNDLPRPADDRANQLLKIFCEIEEYEGRLSEAQFGELLYRAAIACGFVDARDAWQALTESGLGECEHFLPPKPVS